MTDNRRRHAGWLCGLIAVALVATTPVRSQSSMRVFEPQSLTARTVSGFPIGIRFEALSALATDGGLMDLTLSDNLSVRAAVTVRDTDRRQTFLAGRLVNGGEGDVSLTIVGDALLGRVVVDGRLFLIRRGEGTSVHVVQEVDPGSFPPEAEPLVAGDFGQPDAFAGPLPIADTNAFVDLMILYTPAARVRAGGTSSIALIALAAVNNANLALTNANVTHRFRLVHSEETVYTESGVGDTSLRQLTSTNDGVIDSVHALRDLHRADIVTLLTTDSDVCGIGWLMGPNSIGQVFAPLGFNVVNWSCAMDLTLAHELGHNMGLQHDRPNSSASAPSFPYAYGYFVQGVTRDVMSYQSPCNCARSAIFSTPLATFPGIAPPRQAGTATEDNARALNNTALAVANFRQSLTTTSRTTHGDFDGDATTDVTAYRPGEGTWYVLTSTSGYRLHASYQWGASTDTPVPGDYDGDGRIDVAVYRPSSGTWFIRLSAAGGTMLSRVFGTNTDVPVPADYDGDGVTDLAYFRPSNGTWSILRSSTSLPVAYQWGAAGDVPVTGDFDGDRRSELAVYRPSSGVWYVSRSTGGYGSYNSYQWGVNEDVPVASDYDGDGRADVAVYRPSTGNWHVLLSSANYASSVSRQWGAGTDIPVPGDFDGDGQADRTVFRPGTGQWFILRSSGTGTTSVVYQWGVGTDIPIPRRQ